MRPLLRRTREYLAGKGNVQKFILYTIGEIVLVVFGILIALSIDNWNEERKNLAREQEILAQLRKDYNTNLLQLNEKIKMRESIINACENVMDAIDSPSTQHGDSVINQLALLLMDPTFDPIHDDLINSGNIRLIRNPQLKRLLTNWTSDVAEVQDIEKGWQKLLTEIVIPAYIELGFSRDAVNAFWTTSSSDWYLDKQTTLSIFLKKSKTTPHIANILRNPKLEGLMSVAVLYNYSGNIQSYALRSRVLEILELLDKEIES